MELNVIDIKRHSYTGRLRARRVTSQIEWVAERARQSGEPQYMLAHGGDVSCNYSGMAKTEALLEVAFPPNEYGVQYAIRYWAEVKARNVTLAKVAAATISLNSIANFRHTAEARDAARQEMFRFAAEDIRRHVDG